MVYQVKIGDPVTYNEENHWLKGKRAFIYDIIPLDKLDKKYDEWNIVLEFIDEKTRTGIENTASPNYPERKQGRIHCARQDFILGHAPLTDKEVFEQELQGFVQKPWVGLYNFPSRTDHKCAILDCPNYASKHIWVNVWGSGYRFHVCSAHTDEYQLCSCREEIPFKMKKDETLEKKVA
jgi:hypothetical protein